MKWYGSVENRLEEGRNFTGRELQVGDDITMYYWSDRECYYITNVIDQKHIKVKRYHVRAAENGGLGTQFWEYEKDDNYEEETWTYRYNGWWRCGESLDGKKNYIKLQPVSFGVRDYYYDWEF